MYHAVRPARRFDYAARMHLAPLAALLAALAQDPDNLPEPLPAEGCVPVDQLRLSQAADAYRQRYGHDAHHAAHVHGLALNDSARAIGFLQRSLGDQPPPSFQKAVDAGCTRVLCALQHTIGDLEGALWFLVAAAEVNAPPLLDQAGLPVESVWQTPELRALARALLEAPPELKRVTSLKVWRRLPSGEELHKDAKKAVAAGGAFAYNAVSYHHDLDYKKIGTIVIRDTVWKFAQRDQRAVVQHELGHHWEISREEEGQKAASLSDDWLELSNWHCKTRTNKGHDCQLGDGAEIATAGETMPGEDFADSLANYRYAPRLVRAYSKSKFEYLHKLLGKDHLRPEPDKALEEGWGHIGGPLKVVQQCVKSIQRATFGGKLHQTSLYAVMNKAGGGTHWEPVARNQYMAKGHCIDNALAALQKSPAWEQIACRQDPEDVAVQVSDRLEEVWGAFTEAAEEIRKAVPQGAADKCLGHRDLTTKCMAGDEGAEAASREAARILGEFAGGDQAGQADLAKLLLVQSPFAPADEELRERLPVLTSSADLFYACLKGARKISPKPDGAHWMFFYDLPGAGHVSRSYGDPIWGPSCPRDFADHLGTAGFKVDDSDRLFVHLVYLLQLQTQKLSDNFTHNVLGQVHALHCNDAPCRTNWFKGHLAGYAPEGLVDDLARFVAGVVKPH
jgi:hypothetical protein